MEVADFDVKDFEDRNAGDKAVMTRFYLRPVKNEHESALQGRPIFYDREYVEIRASGNSQNIVNRPASDLDRQRFARQYAMFKAGNDEQVVGTRLTEVAWLTRSQVEELAYLKVMTLENLASLNDQTCINVPGLHDLKRRAKLALEQAENAAPLTALQQENSELKSQLAALTETVQEQTKLLKELQAKK